jgi:hypothetical protein
MNHHLLEVAWSLMFTMNVPRFLWSERLLISWTGCHKKCLGWWLHLKWSMAKMSLLFQQRCLGIRALLETTCLKWENWIHVLWSASLLDTHLDKKIFKCWSPSERRAFMSMDMTFWALLWGKPDLSSLFDFNSPSTIDASREGESEPLRRKEDEPSKVVIGSIPWRVSEERWRKPNEGHNLKAYTTKQPTSEGRWRKSNEKENLRVYTRRQSQHQ